MCIVACYVRRAAILPAGWLTVGGGGCFCGLAGFWLAGLGKKEGRGMSGIGWFGWQAAGLGLGGQREGERGGGGGAPQSKVKNAPFAVSFGRPFRSRLPAHGKAATLIEPWAKLTSQPVRKKRPPHFFLWAVFFPRLARLLPTFLPSSPRRAGPRLEPREMRCRTEQGAQFFSSHDGRFGWASVPRETSASRGGRAYKNGQGKNQPYSHRLLISFSRWL